LTGTPASTFVVEIRMSPCPHRRAAVLRRKFGHGTLFVNFSARRERITRAGLARGESDSGLFCLLTIMTRDELWTSVALLVDGLRVTLRRFRKSHHLILAGLGGNQETAEEIAAGGHAFMSACCVA
jgi:hypothetical protein